MRGAVVYKMSGSGNDFVFVDGRMSPLKEWGSEEIARVCHRQTGVGGDGFAVLEPGTGAGRVRFHFFNRDGSRAPMCGNGALCATQLACVLELVQGPDMILETDTGDIVSCTVDGPSPRSRFNLADVSQPTTPAIRLHSGECSVHFVRVGVPHLVIAVDDLSSVAVTERGRELRHHEILAPDGANVNFVAVDPPESGRWRMRTYERGVEAETLACGTGAVACAVALMATGAVHGPPWDVTTSSGKTLTVGGTLQQPNRLVGPTLTGEARMVFRAVLR